MPSLLSGSSLNNSSPTGYVTLNTAQYQLGPTPSTSTGYTLISTGSVVSYASSLGNIQFAHGQIYSNQPNQNLILIGTGTTSVLVTGGTTATSTATGSLQVQGDASFWGTIYTGQDANINGVTVGQGWKGDYNISQNNIVITGVLNTLTNNTTDGENSIAIGYNTLAGLTSAYKTIAIGSNVITTGTEVENTIAIGDGALRNIGTVHSIPVGPITLVNGTNPAIVTVDNHGLSSGTYVLITDVMGSEGYPTLNGGLFYVKPIDVNRLELYTDINMFYPVDGTGWTEYVSDGILSIDTAYNDNIALGTNAALNLINGQQNFFLGDNLAINLTTGSYNLFIGHDVANNMHSGNANISIGGDQLIDGLDNQVNIGSLLYYDGVGYTQMNSNLGVGLGTWGHPTFFISAIEDATQTNPVVITSTATYIVTTGTEIIITDVVGMTELNKQIYFASYLTSSTFSLYYDWQLTQPVDGSLFGMYISGGNINKLEPTGALSVIGGVGIKGNLIVTSHSDFYSGMYVRSLITGTITTSTNLAGGDIGSIPYQSSTGTTLFIPIGEVDTVLISNGTTATWQHVGSMSAGNASTVSISPVTQHIYYPTVAVSTSTSSAISVDIGLSYVVTTTNTSSYFTSGTNLLNVPGIIYSMDGNPDENNRLYTPRVTISTAVAPTDPRVGDFWVDPSGPYELQYVNDGGNFIWVQFTGL